MKFSAFDRLTLKYAPRWTLARVRARAAAEVFMRHYEAAQGGRRTSGWARSRGDANAATAVAISELRMHARDLIRNCSWAKRAQRVIANNTAGWGIVPRPSGPDAKAAGELWRAWAESPECESGEQMTFYGVQTQVMRTVAEAGEVLIRRRWRSVEDKYALPLQLQVLEPDHIDSSKDGMTGVDGGPIIQGVEFDKLGRRQAYWLFPEHPGSSRGTGVSQRVSASEIRHVYFLERPGQVRGVSWFGSAVVDLKDFDEYEDATLVRQKIAACFAAFVTDVDGVGQGIGASDPDDDLIDKLEPGMIVPLPPGKQITTASPPAVVEDSFTTRRLRKIAAGLGISYEDMTGDYSQVNYSSARMSRISHWANVRDWQNNMMIPLFCQGVWDWAMEAAETMGAITQRPVAEWTTPPMPMVEPVQEARAYKELMRNGVLTFSEMVREQGGDPEQHFEEYAADLARLDRLGIKLDGDVRAVSNAGLTQERIGGRSSEAPADDEPK